MSPQKVVFVEHAKDHKKEISQCYKTLRSARLNSDLKGNVYKLFFPLEAVSGSSHGWSLGGWRGLEVGKVQLLGGRSVQTVCCARCCIYLNFFCLKSIKAWRQGKEPCTYSRCRLDLSCLVSLGYIFNCWPSLMHFTQAFINGDASWMHTWSFAWLEKMLIYCVNKIVPVIEGFSVFMRAQECVCWFSIPHSC